MGKSEDKEAKKAAKRAAEAATTEADDKAAKKAAKKAKKEAEEAAAAAPAVDEKAAKKEKKEKKKREAEEAEAAPPAKAAKGEDGEKVKLSKEEKAAKKAAKEAKKEGKEEPAADFAPPPAFSPTKTEIPASDGENTRLFVGNLSFKMTEEWLKQEFAGAGEIANVDWLMHQDTGRFKGAVFVTMASAEGAQAAIDTLNGKDCDGRPMKVEMSQPKAKKPDWGAKPALDDNPPSASVFLGNLSWSVDEDQTRALFADCGAIANLKWMMKDGEFRGMAFIDFETIEAATNAVAKNGTDLCGRPVRVNFSKPREPRSDAKPAWGAAGGAAGKVQRPSKPQGEKPDGCTELFCGNLSWTIDETKVADFFKTVGATVTGTRWLNDKESGEFKGIGFVSFGDTADVDKAVALGGEMLDGRTIRIDYAGAKKKEGAWQGGSW